MATTKKNNRVWIVLLGACWSVALLCFLWSLIASLLQPEANEGGGPVCAWWGFGLAGLLTLAGLGLTSIFILGHLEQARAHRAEQRDQTKQVQSAQAQSLALLTQISENILLSDAVKSIAFREKDHMVLQAAIEEDMKNKRWDSVAMLIEGLEERFGSKEEAQKLREELQRQRQAAVEDKIHTVLKHIESLWMIHDYEQAERQEQALLEMYPNLASIQRLGGETQKRKEGHKQELLERWNRAVEEKDFEQGVELLKLLDKYLTTDEAAALQESARGVFKGKLQNMGVQFSLYVTEKQWIKALQVGKKIIEEFPMSRIAQEVQEKIEILEQRASEPS